MNPFPNQKSKYFDLGFWKIVHEMEIRGYPIVEGRAAIRGGAYGSKVIQMPRAAKIIG